MENFLLAMAFCLIGAPIGFLVMLIFRISIHQKKFSWPGALTTITTLTGGAYLSYATKPIHFALYALGFFIGFSLYIYYLAASKRSLKGTSRVGGFSEGLARIRGKKSDDGEGDVVVAGEAGGDEDGESRLVAASGRSRRPRRSPPEIGGHLVRLSPGTDNKVWAGIVPLDGVSDFPPVPFAELDYLATAVLVTPDASAEVSAAVGSVVLTAGGWQALVDQGSHAFNPLLAKRRHT